MKAKSFVSNQKKVRNMNKPTMYMTVGLPGCGKSTWAREQDMPIFSSDELRKKMPEADNNKIFQILHKQIKETLSNGQSCIFDATNLSRKHRRSLVEALNSVECTKTCVFFLMPVSVCMERNRGREGDARVPDEVYDRMLRSFNVPSTKYDGFDEILLHAYEADFELPDYEHLDDFSQDNPHHAESLGEHMKMAYEAARQLSEDKDDKIVKLAKEAARWHDIGKVHTKDFHNAKGDVSEEAHYYGHDNYGAYMYLLKWLKETPENERATTLMQALNVAEVINWHMAPHTVWQESKKHFKYDRERLDPDIVKAIDLVYEADKEAMIEEDLEKDERNW